MPFRRKASYGSAGLGTTVRPLGREDFDVDTIYKVLLFLASGAPAELKKIVGDRLKENARYAGMLEEKKRCWRLNYAREYHLDISPEGRRRASDGRLQLCATRCSAGPPEAGKSAVGDRRSHE